MRRATQPRCRHGCRFLQITPGLYLCPHASWGFTSNLRGAVDEARLLLAKAGGYETLLAELVADEEKKRAERKETLALLRERLAESVRYD